MLRLTALHLAAGALAIAAISSTGTSARAFTQENLNATNPDGTSRFADPDDRVKNFGGAQPFGQNGPTVNFGVHQGPGPYSPYAPFGQLRSNNVTPPDPYARPLGNGD